MLTDALVLSEPGAPFKYQKVSILDTLEPNECRVRIRASGICHTDINFASKERGIPENFPCILGHEGAGTVTKVGSSVTNVRPNDAVIVTFTSCGDCNYCDSGHSSYCDVWFQYNFTFSRLDGSQTVSDPKTRTPIKGHFFGQSSFARDIIVSSRALIPIPHPPSFSELAPLGCGVMTGAGTLLNILRPTPQDSILILGCGAVGLSAIMACKTLPNNKPPRRIIAVDTVPARLDLARKYGATHGINTAHTPDLMGALMHVTKGRGVDGTIDTTARPEVVKQAIHATARRGKIVAVGVGSLGNEVAINTFEAVQAGFTYQGSNQGDAEPGVLLPWLLGEAEEGRFPYKELVRTYPVREVERAVRDVKDGKVVKAVLEWD
jgi:aryl-alcohol dehydrogenase